MLPTKLTLTAAFALLILVGIPDTAQAYVGPGLGAGAIGAVLGVLGAVLLAIFSLIYYPLKRAMRKRKVAGQATPTRVGEATRANQGG